MPTLFSFLLLSFFLTSMPASANATEVHGTPYVLDGDTLAFGDTRIRLEGIDAPESDQTCEHPNGLVQCGAAATLFVRDTINTQSVSCQIQSYDRYGRGIATCYVNGQNLNALIVANGWAMAYRRYSSAYIADEETAQSQSRGIWSTRFIAPWDWRRQ